MSAILATRVKQHIMSIVKDHLDLDDCLNDEDKILSRGLTAIALSSTIGIKYTDIKKYITDGTKDNGIDAAYFDTARNKLFVIQSKWSHKGTSTIGVGDIGKFIDGTYDLLNEEWTKFNIRIKNISSEISLGIRNDPEIVLIAAFNSNNPLSQEITDKVNDFLTENNSDAQEVVSFEIFDLNKIVRAIKATKDGGKSDIEVNLLQWGEKNEPYYSVYGKVSCADIAEWYSQHGDLLFTENIRNTLPESDINNQIENTIQKSPREFWYLNNGITAIADSVKRKPIGLGDQKDSSFWKVGNVKIVNGAQTTGSIYRAFNKWPQATRQAYVQIKIISLENAPLDLASKITTATNTQNKVEPKDFLALEEQQAGIAEAFHKIGIQYCYRRGEKVLNLQKGTDVQELAMVLAVTSSSMSDVTIAKRNAGSLTDPNGHYRKIFPPEINTLSTWQSILSYRKLKELIEKLATSLVGKDAQLAVHGNRFIEHIALKNKKITASDIEKIHNELNNKIRQDYPESYLAVLFKNAKKCEAISKDLKI